MPKSPRIVLLTSAERRHRYVASVLASSLRMLAIVAERKHTLPAVESAAARRESTESVILAAHFGERDAAEARYFGDAAFPHVPRLDCAPGQANDAKVRDWVAKFAPDYVLLYGTSIIRPPLLTDYDDRMVNLHLGLSPYYRGAGTNFWPLVDGVPECVGATIHLAVLKVDAGAVLSQVRPEASAEDSAHDLGCKTIAAAADIMGETLTRYANRELSPSLQDLRLGKVFRKSDFNAQAVVDMNARFNAGMLREYCDRREERCSRYPIHEL